MIAPAYIPAARPLTYCTFEAYRIRDIKWHDAEPELIGCFDDDRDAALRAAEQASGHGGWFYLRATNHMTRKTVLSFYKVKQSSKPIPIRAAADMAHAKQFKPLYSEHQFDLAEGNATGGKA